jgi:hypothetical protein
VFEALSCGPCSRLSKSCADTPEQHCSFIEQSRSACRWSGETPGLLANPTCIHALHDAPRDRSERARVRDGAATSSAVTKLGLQSAACDPVDPTCGLTFELSGPWRRGALADQCNMIFRTGRPGCHAGAGRIERRVRPQRLGRCRAFAAATDNALAQPRSASRDERRALRDAAQHLASAGLAAAAPRREVQAARSREYWPLPARERELR